MEQQILGVTNETLHERKKGYLLALIMVPIAFIINTVVFIILKPRTLMSNEAILTFMAIMIITITIVQIIAQRFMLKKLSKQKLIVTDKLICRVGEYTVHINYEDINKIIFKLDKKNRILFIKIHFYRKHIKLVEFEGMDLILKQLQKAVDKQCRVFEIRNKIMWNSPKKNTIIFTSVFILLMTIYFVLLIPREFNRSYEGVKYRLGDKNEEVLENVTIEFKGTIYRTFTLEEKFKGSIRINEYVIPSDKNLADFIELDFSHDDWIREIIPYIGFTTFGNLYMSKDRNQLSIYVLEGDSWNGSNGLMISAPATNRREALSITNKVMKDLFYGEFTEFK